MLSIPQGLEIHIGDQGQASCAAELPCICPPTRSKVAAIQAKPFLFLFLEAQRSHPLQRVHNNAQPRATSLL